MKWTGKCVLASLLALVCASGLTFFLASVRPAVADQVDVTPLPPVQETDGRAGACFSYYYEHGNRPFLPLMHDAGVRHDRFDFRWDSIQEHGYSEYDKLVDDNLAAGVDIIGILWATPAGYRKPGCDPAVGLGTEGGLSSGERPPGWHAPETGGVNSFALAASDSGACPPAGLYNPWTVSDFNGNYWAEFVYNTVMRYQDRVRVWEIWNEAEWSWFWLGSDAEYARLLKVGYQAIKAADPDAVVLFAGLHYWADPTFFERVLDILNDDPDAQANNGFFDVMSVHLYSRSSNTYDVVNNIRARMGFYVSDHPIWLTETGVPVYDGAYPGVRSDYGATEEEAAAYLIQSYANAIAADVGRYYWFRAHDHDWDEHFGLTHDENYLRPAYVAYQVATTYLVSPTFTTRVPTASRLRVTLWGTPRAKVSVLWNESPATGVYTLPAALEEATLVDRWGVTETITAVSGVYTFTLPGATASRVDDSDDYFIGGDPLIVVESETPNEPPTSTVQTLPERVYSPTLTVDWEGQDNQAGVWLYDIQVRDEVDGTWEDWVRSTSDVSGQFSGQHDHTYYFRSRATDRVGNRGDWPEAPQAQATFDLSSTLHLSIGAFFADENRDDVWNQPISGTNEITFTEEVTLTQVALRFLDPSGHDVLSPTVGATWEFTTTIYAGQTYRLQAASGDYSRVVPLVWPRGGKVYTRSYESLGLWPGTWVYLPLVLSDAG